MLMILEPHLSGTILVFVAAAAILAAGIKLVLAYGRRPGCRGRLVHPGGHRFGSLNVTRDLPNPCGDPSGDSYQILQSICRAVMPSSVAWAWASNT